MTNGRSRDFEPFNVGLPSRSPEFTPLALPACTFESVAFVAFSAASFNLGVKSSAK